MAGLGRTDGAAHHAIETPVNFNNSVAQMTNNDVLMTNNLGIREELGLTLPGSEYEKQDNETFMSMLMHESPRRDNEHDRPFDPRTWLSLSSSQPQHRDVPESSRSGSLNPIRSHNLTVFSHDTLLSLAPCEYQQAVLPNINNVGGTRPDSMDTNGPTRTVDLEFGGRIIQASPVVFTPVVNTSAPPVRRPTVFPPLVLDSLHTNQFVEMFAKTIAATRVGRNATRPPIQRPVPSPFQEHYRLFEDLESPGVWHTHEFFRLMKEYLGLDDIMDRCRCELCRPSQVVPNEEEDAMVTGDGPEYEIEYDSGSDFEYDEYSVVHSENEDSDIEIIFASEIAHEYDQPLPPELGHPRAGSLRANVDVMSYEQILDLQNQIGHVNVGLTDDLLTQAVRREKYQPPAPGSSSPSSSSGPLDCTICFELFQEGEEVGILKCDHDFHYKCIGNWLKRKKSCPLCRMNVLQN